MKKVARVVAFILSYLLLQTGLFWLISYLPVYSNIRSTATTISIAFTNSFMLGLFLIYRHRTHNRWVSEEADKWLANKRAENSKIVRQQKRNFVRILVWLPALLVTGISLFVPEMIGLVLHGARPDTVSMGKLQIKIPRTWIGGSGSSDYLYLMTAPGVGRIGFMHYWHHNVPPSEMLFYPVPHPELNFYKNVPLDGATILAKRSFPLGEETLSCWDLIHNNPYVGPRPKDPMIADISCSTESGHFYAHFDGWRRDANTFYEVLENIVVKQ
jgi:hypothetical protein